MRLTVNGRSVETQASGDTPLLYILRNDLGLNGPKFGCGLGECGACAVLVDGALARSCVLPLISAEGRSITTLEGLAREGILHPVQQAFISEQATQCGYCLNGMIITIVALLATTPDPSEAQIRKALRHNLCRCGAHIEIMQAALEASRLLNKVHLDG